MNSSAARIGYARVSTADRNLDTQMAALQAARCTMVRTETSDGATLAARPELRTILDFIHPGETLVVTRIDRLARSMRDLQVIVATLKLTEAVAIALREVHDHAFSVTNGRMVRAERIHEGPGGSNHWRMTVEPTDETKPVTVTLPGNRACGERGALCTRGGTQLTSSPTLTPSIVMLTIDSSNLPNISIENTTAKENNASLNFTVKLSRAAAQTVAVDFMTVSGGAATEGADYRAQDYRVLFTPGETSVEAGVALIADTVDDIGETVRAEIANARVITERGAELGPLTIATAEATGTINAPATSTTDVSIPTIRIDNTTGDQDDGWLNFR